MKKRILFFIAPFLLLSGSLTMIPLTAGAEEDRLKKTAVPCVIDGVVEPGEYSLSRDFKQMKLYLNRTSERLYVALTAETEGWVGIGFKSKVMNNAEVVMGFVKDGKTYLYQQSVKGRAHDDKKLPYVKSSAIRESSKMTVLEVELLAQDLIEPDQKVLPLVIAFGNADSITQYHKQRAGLEIKLLD